MSFHWPVVLSALLLVPLLLVGYLVMLRRRQRYALRYASLSLVRDAVGKGPGLRRHIPPALFLVSLTAMIVAFARPEMIVTLPSRESLVILALDVSGSMRAQDLQPDRLEAAKQAALAFVDRQDPSTRIGVVSFSGTADVVQAPTTDHDAVIAAIRRLRTQRATAIGSGILTSLSAISEALGTLPGAASAGSNSLTPTPRPAVRPAASPTVKPTPLPTGQHIPAIIVLLTDGRNTTGPSPVAVAQDAVDRGVRVYTIGVGTQQGAVIPPGGGGFPGGGGGGFPGGGPGGGGFGGGFRADLDEPTLQTVAKMTDGEYFRATDENDLRSIYENLNTQVILRTERNEITVLVTAAALVLSVLGGMLSLLWFNRLP